MWTYYVLPVGIIFTAPLNKKETVSLAYLMQLLFDANSLYFVTLTILLGNRKGPVELVTQISALK